MEVGRMEEFFWSFILVLLERIAGGDGKDVVTGSIKWEERVSVKALNDICFKKDVALIVICIEIIKILPIHFF